jgi:50S ribosomal subunit-associated GTPase HflX
MMCSGTGVDDVRKLPAILVGNKIDLLNRDVPPEIGNEYADHLGMPFIETSRMTGENCAAVLDLLAR